MIMVDGRRVIVFVLLVDHGHFEVGCGRMRICLQRFLEAFNGSIIIAGRGAIATFKVIWLHLLLQTIFWNLKTAGKQ